MAVPNIISNVSVPLMSSVDTSLMGHLSTQHLVAVGLASMIFNMFFWAFGFLRMGTTGMTAQSYGSSDSKAISLVLYRGIAIALILGVTMIAFKVQIFTLGDQLFSIETRDKSLVQQYINVRIWEAPAYLILISFFGWFFGLQNARIPMWITISINIINIATSYYAVHYLEYGIAGVAMGTVIATYSGVFLSIAIALLKYSGYINLFRLHEVFHVKEFVSLLRVNKDIFIRTLALTASFVILYREASSFGSIILAVTVVMLQFINWMSYGIDGYAYAAESLVGKYHGQKDSKALAQVVKWCLIWGLALGVVYSIVYGLGALTIGRLFTDDVAVLDKLSHLRWWLILIPLVGFGSYIWDGIFVGLVASKGMRNSMLAAFLLFAFALYTLPVFPLHQEIWVAFALFLAVRAGYQSLLYWKYQDNLK